MPRPSQCYACGCFEHCLNPESPQCAERPAAAVAVLDVDDYLEAMQEYGERVAEESAPPDDDRDYQLSLIHDEDI